MPWWKQLLLAAYCGGSGPYRRWRNARIFRSGRAPVVVLFAHRIADDRASPWTMPCCEFARQMRWLKQRFDMVSLEEAQRRIRSGSNSRIAVSMTFDDGYAANCDFAVPLLLELDIPCTYFVSVNPVVHGAPFEHDRACGYLGHPNTLTQLREMAQAGIEIGAHTRTHADLGRITDPLRLYDEVVAAGEDLQQALGRAVRYFAFPFGHWQHLNPEAFRLADEHGYEAVCSAYGGYNYPGDDAFHLQRIHLDYLARLKNWLSLDPRYRYVPRRYQYQRALPASPPTGVRL